MDLGLKGARAFVSGSTQGIGYAVAASLLTEGASVIVNGRTEERVTDSVERLRAAAPGAEVSGIAADLSDPAQVRMLGDALGAVDVLVNNAGIFEVAALDEIDDETWARYWQVNTMAAVAFSRALLPGMLARDRGRILFIGTESAVDVPADMLHYGATKAAALAFANGLAKLTRGSGVTVNTVLGGPTSSTGVVDAVAGIAAAQGMDVDDLTRSLVRDSSLLQRFIEPEEIAHLVTYLASPRASATNGAALRADGGVLKTVL